VRFTLSPADPRLGRVDQVWFHGIDSGGPGKAGVVLGRGV
jgi:hypothetical protein